MNQGVGAASYFVYVKDFTIYLLTEGRNFRCLKSSEMPPCLINSQFTGVLLLLFSFFAFWCQSSFMNIHQDCFQNLICETWCRKGNKDDGSVQFQDWRRCAGSNRCTCKPWYVSVFSYKYWIHEPLPRKVMHFARISQLPLTHNCHALKPHFWSSPWNRL